MVINKEGSVGKNQYKLSLKDLQVNIQVLGYNVVENKRKQSKTNKLKNRAYQRSKRKVYAKSPFKSNNDHLLDLRKGNTCLIDKSSVSIDLERETRKGNALRLRKFKELSSE